MGCCLNRPIKKRNPNKSIERSQTLKTAIVKQQPVKESQSCKEPEIPEYAKQWMQQQTQSPQKQSQIAKQPQGHPSTPPPPSKRRQLLRDLFKEAKNKPKQLQLRTEEAENNQSNLQDNNSLKAIQEVIKQVIGRNKQELTSCGICTQQYSQQRAPLMICLSQHTFCSECVGDLWKKGFKRCPLDQTPFDLKNVQKNRLVLSILEQMPK